MISLIVYIGDDHLIDVKVRFGHHHGRQILQNTDYILRSRVTETSERGVE